MKRVLYIGLQLGLTGLMLVGLLYYQNREVKPTDVYVYTQDIPANTEVTANMVKKVVVPQKAVTEGFALQGKDVVGKYTNHDVFAEQYAYKRSLVSKSKVDPFLNEDFRKKRKISLPITYATGFGGNIKRGDRVDVLYSAMGRSNNAEFGYAKASTTLQDVLVYSVTTKNGFAFQDHSQASMQDANEAAEKSKNNAATEELAVVTLVVTVEQAEEIAARLKTGDVRLLGRFEDSETYSTVGYVVGDYKKVYAGQASAETKK